MNRNTITLLFTILAIGTLLFWVRLSNSPSVPEPKEVKTFDTPSDFGQLMNKLSQNFAETWETLGHEQQTDVVQAIIQLYRVQNRGIIAKPAEFYVDFINQTLVTNQEIRSYPVDRVLLILAVMEYDFDNGQDPDKFAIEVLGSEMYAANKERRARLGVS